MKIEFWGQEFEVKIWVGLVGGFFIAIISSMFGFGGGPFAVPLLTVGMGLPMYVTVGTSLLAIFFNTLMGSSRHYLFGNTDLILFLAMFTAAILGGFIGPQIARRLPPVAVKRVAVVGLWLLGLKLLGLY